jgi:HEAT repeat protein
MAQALNMSQSSSQPDDRPAEPAAAQPRRWRSSLKTTRGLLLLVLLIAGLFGGWNEWKRRDAVGELIGRLSSGRIHLMPPIPAAATSGFYHWKRSAAAGVFGPQVRRIQALHAEPIAVDALVQVIHDVGTTHDSDSARGALACLFLLGPDSARALPEMVALAMAEDSPDQPAQRRALKSDAIHGVGILARIDDAGPTVTVLRRALGGRTGDRVRPIRQGAVDALGAIGPLARDAVPDLVRLLSESDRSIRLSAIMALGQIGPASAPGTPAILASLKDPDDQIRTQSVISLGEIAQPYERIPEMLAALENLARNDSGVQGVANRALMLLRWSQQRVENRARLLPLLTPEARQRFLEKVADDEIREARWGLR